MFTQDGNISPTQTNDQGGIIDIALTINASNVAVVCPKTGDAGRVGYRLDVQSRYHKVWEKLSTVTLTEPRMKVLYRETVRDQLQSQLGLANIMQVPKLSKISVNAGVGDTLVNRAFLDGAVEDLTKITGRQLSPVQKS